MAEDRAGPGLARVAEDGASFWEGQDWGWRRLWVDAERVVEATQGLFAIAAESAQLMSGGLLNQTWLLRCADRDRVLRVGRSERTLEQVTYEQKFSQALARHVPQVISAEAIAQMAERGEHQEHVLSLFPLCRGVPGTTISPVRRAELLAPVMATMHRNSQDLNLAQRPGMSAVDDQPVGFGWTIVREAVEERFGRGGDVMVPISDVERAIETLDDDLDAWRKSGRLASRATVHGDLNARNQLYREGELVGIVDTDDCRVEPLIWEVAGLAYSDATVSPQTVWDFYIQAGGPLDPADSDLLLPFARLGTLSELQWIIDETGSATHLGLRTLQAIAHDLVGSPTRG